MNYLAYKLFVRKHLHWWQDPLASIFLNLVLKKYGELPPTYQVVGFDDSPIASEYLIPFSTIHQQIDVLTKEAMDILVMQMKNRKKRRPAIMETPIHKTVLPTLIKRETTNFSFYPKVPESTLLAFRDF